MWEECHFETGIIPATLGDTWGVRKSTKTNGAFGFGLPKGNLLLSWYFSLIWFGNTHEFGSPILTFTPTVARMLGQGMLG